MASNKTPEVNASSMADIAFLLLIFFLVTTTMDVDTGIGRILPPPADPSVKPPDFKTRNVMNVLVNKSDRLLINGHPGNITTLKEEVKEFITPHVPNNADFPEVYEDNIALLGTVYRSRALISLKNSRGTSYKMYIAVQDKLAQAFIELRDELSMKKFARHYDDLDEDSKKAINKAIPARVSEAEPDNIGSN